MTPKPNSVLLLVLVTVSCVSNRSVTIPDDASPAGIVDAPAADAGAQEASSTTDARPGPATYTNPLMARDFPDPFVLRDERRYFAFSTNSNDQNVPAATSDDLVNWTELPDALPTLPTWAAANVSLTWAPSVLRRGASFVLYYTARDKAAGFQCIGRAVSPSPAGPYVDDSTAPFICQVTEPAALCGSIDPSPFVAANGDAYLLWKSDENAASCGGAARLWSQRLGVDGLSLLDAPTELLKRDRNWEAPLVEGPSMVEVGSTYYLFYSANWWESPDYGVGYATCTTPRGPCTKKTLDGPLVKSGVGALGPGGQEFFGDASGRLWMAYHAWSAPMVGYANGGARSLRIDPISFVGGVPSVVGPTTSASTL